MPSIVVNATSATNAAKKNPYGEDDIGTFMYKYDQNGDGQFSPDEVRAIVVDVQNEKSKTAMLKQAIAGLFFLLVLVLSAIFAISIVAGEAIKETKVDPTGAMTVKGSSNIMSVHEAKVALPLYVAPVLPPSRLEEIDKVMFTSEVEDVNNNKLQATVHMEVTKIYSFSDVHLEIHGPDGTIISIKNGLASVSSIIDGGRVEAPICEADLTCSAITVDDESEKEILTRDANAALKAAGHPPTGRSLCAGHGR